LLRFGSPWLAKVVNPAVFTGNDQRGVAMSAQETTNRDPVSSVVGTIELLTDPLPKMEGKDQGGCLVSRYLEEGFSGGAGRPRVWRCGGRIQRSDSRMPPGRGDAGRRRAAGPEPGLRWLSCAVARRPPSNRRCRVSNGFCSPPTSARALRRRLGRRFSAPARDW